MSGTASLQCGATHAYISFAMMPFDVPKTIVLSKTGSGQTAGEHSNREVLFAGSGDGRAGTSLTASAAAI